MFATVIAGCQQTVRLSVQIYILHLVRSGSVWSWLCLVQSVSVQLGLVSIQFGLVQPNMVSFFLRLSQ